MTSPFPEPTEAISGRLAFRRFLFAMRRWQQKRHGRRAPVILADLTAKSNGPKRLEGGN